ncbi:1-acyl-sn-glycerol-3-phosphate acyltransferase [Dysgonomonas sp. 520]|uniref:1-acyl-sn-glycerol-3-phosphate acyltransferase n=1 Tax=Dysgonomonas sp. 520 TaxID=2302931 RepID=UPI0013D00810|nr:1-acyl-sn-glycerol-3-phosphate acyltransferase [Dysgonomonas sp. 520]NDW08838.1 acyltransferase [Dysgonomonas sp. 520]
MRKIYSFILKFLGWKIVEEVKSPSKCIICVAPHTSNWDLIVGKMIYGAMGKKANFLMKKSWFFFPLNLLFRAMGGIPVDRSKKNSLTEQLAEEFAKRDEFRIAITPEGTRKYNADWKKGFYYIALGAKVPILIAVLDYGDKTVYFKDVLTPSGDIETDMPKIKAYYKGAKGKIPHLFSEK